MPRGWLLLLCAVLFVWQPFTVAGEVAATLPSIGMRGATAVGELIAHGLIAVLSVAAARALWTASPVGPVLAQVAMIGTAVIGVQSLYWSVLPRQTNPDDKLPLAILTVAHAAVWLAYLRRSSLVKRMFAGNTGSSPTLR